MRFTSPFKLFNVGVLKERIIRHPTTGDIIEVIPAVRAVFGVAGAEFTYQDPDTGKTERGADIHGGMFDTVIAQKEEGWTDEVREAVERRLLALTERWPEACQLVSKPKAPKPWPKYDETHHNQIPVLAESLGFVAEALAYEQENKNRESVTQKLEEILSREPEVTAEELTAA